MILEDIPADFAVPVLIALQNARVALKGIALLLSLKKIVKFVIVQTYWQKIQMNEEYITTLLRCNFIEQISIKGLKIFLNQISVIKQSSIILDSFTTPNDKLEHQQLLLMLTMLTITGVGIVSTINYFAWYH